ncbi:Protein mahjong [Chionoecetes opilio]|uniref:Protein mahjong n=1 Tax=Chionoecetes opilio TaxID=41210 RepID=A0A8J5D5K7_CHIOP|nr:Protein mahjong [Chionoecetes opilio]
MRLFSWAESGQEPLRTYATGLLAAAMDVPEIAASFRDYNTHLVPLMLRRLWELKDEATTTPTTATPTKNMNASGTFNIFGSPKSTSRGIDGGEALELLQNSDCSNSSWAEMGSFIVGTYQMFPVTRDTQQMFILKYLRPIGEYQEVSVCGCVCVGVGVWVCV